MNTNAPLADREACPIEWECNCRAAVSVRCLLSQSSALDATRNKPSGANSALIRSHPCTGTPNQNNRMDQVEWKIDICPLVCR